jgi:UDP:flavonoid glycosyltransferase YjiC (YdhE family)
VSEPCDLAAPAEAAAAGIPVVLHSFGRPMARKYYETASPFVAPLWRSAGCEPRALCGIYPPIYVDICPPSLRCEAIPDDTKVLQLRPTMPNLPAESPAWLSSLPDRPTVYVTLGTIFNAIDRFRPLLAALGGLECNAILTIGRNNDPAALGPIPENTIVERFIPQDLLLPNVDVMVGHGGSGSMLAAFARGVPQLMLPAGADQFDNADACQRLGLARVLLPADVTTAAIREQLTILLSDERYGQRAHALAEEMASMPEPRDVAEQIVFVLLARRDTR